MQLVSFAIVVTTSLCCTVALFFENGTCFYLNAKILPEVPLFMRGENITLTCIIDTSCYTGPVNASSLGFSIYNTIDYPPEHPYVNYVNETTTELTVPFANFNNGGQYECAQFENGAYKERFGKVDFPVQVGIPPELKNNSFDCFVDNWDDMNCSFDPGPPTNLPTTYNWSYGVNAGLYFACPDYDRKSRTCKWLDILFAQVYWMKVKATNDLGNSESVGKIDPLILVKPAPVNNIKIQAIGSSSVVIDFDVDKYEKPQKFRIFYKSKFDDMYLYIEVDIDKNATTKTVNVTINGLIPFAEYSYMISAIPSIKGKPTGFWSKNATAHSPFQQPSDVPWAAPVFAPGSFQRSDCINSCPSFCGDNCAEVTIFWPKVEERYRNGNILAYKIGGGARTEADAAGISVSKKLYVYNNRNYTISITAATKEGFSPNSSAIYIPRKIEAPAAPESVAAIRLNSSTVRVKWQQTVGNGQQLPTSYTVFWCKGNGQCIYIEGSDLYSKIVPADVNGSIHINTAEGDPDEYWFSVSANNDLRHSSGMVSSECVYKPDNVLLPPVLKKSSLEGDYVIAIDWSVIPCKHKDDAIIYYEVWFCKVQPGKNGTCQAGTEKTEKASSRETRHIITSDVEADSLYLVWAFSVTASSKSAESNKIEINTSGLSSVEIAGIVVGAVFGLILICCGIFFVCRKCCKDMHQFCVHKYPINMPGNDYRDEELCHVNYIDTQLCQPLSDDSTQSISVGSHRRIENEENQKKLENQKRNQPKSLVESENGSIEINSPNGEGSGKKSDMTDSTSQDYAKFGVNNRTNSSNGNRTVPNGKLVPLQHVTVGMAVMEPIDASYEGYEYRKGIPVTMVVHCSADTEDDGYKPARIRMDPCNVDRETEQELSEAVTDSENDDSGSHDLFGFQEDKDGTVEDSEANSYKGFKLKESVNSNEVQDIAERDEANTDSSGSTPYKGFTFRNVVDNDNRK